MAERVLTPRRHAGPGPGGAPRRLTARELEVAGLVAEGLTNAAIGARLHVSPWTVGSHVAHMLAKLGFSSRAQVAAWYGSSEQDDLDEPDRLTALRYYQVLDSDPEPAFDRITALAARLLAAPFALISFVDERRQWFKSAHGIVVKETPRQGGFCAAAITCASPTVIADARADESFARHPMVVGFPGIRMYAGAPLTTADGHNLGTVCVLDRQPRTLDASQVAILADLAVVVMELLEARMAGIRLSRSERLRREARRHADRMADLDRLKSDFLLLASHELRGPVSVVKGYTSMMADGSLGSLPGSVEAILPRMTATIASLEGLVERMLESARVEGARAGREPATFELGAVVGGAVAGFSGGLHRVRWTPVPEPVPVLGEPAAVTTIVAHLLDNALKFSPEACEVRCELGVEAAAAHLAVSDSGPGISAANRAGLFTRFGRVLSPDDSHVEGAGLGLFLARELARGVGGDVTVASAPGEGSTFTLHLRRAGDPPAPS